MKTRKIKSRKSVRGGASANIDMIPCSVTPIRGIDIQSNLRRYLRDDLISNMNSLERYARPITDHKVGTYHLEVKYQLTEKNIVQEAIAIKLKLCSHESPIYKLFEAYFTSQDGPILPYMELSPGQQLDLGKEFYNDTEKPEAIKEHAYYVALDILRNIAHLNPNIRLIWIPSTKEVPEMYMRKHRKYTKGEIIKLNRKFAETVVGKGKGDAFMGTNEPGVMSRFFKTAKNTFGRLNRTRRSFTPSLRRGSSVSVGNPLAEAEPFFDNGSGSNNENVFYPTTTKFHEQ